MGKLAEEGNRWTCKSAGDERGESQRLVREEAILEPLGFTEVNKKSPMENIAGESEISTEIERMLDPSNPVGDPIKEEEGSKLLIDDLSMKVTQDVKANPTM